MKLVTLLGLSVSLFVVGCDNGGGDKSSSQSSVSSQSSSISLPVISIPDEANRFRLQTIDFDVTAEGALAEVAFYQDEENTSYVGLVATDQPNSKLYLSGHLVNMRESNNFGIHPVISGAMASVVDVSLGLGESYSQLTVVPFGLALEIHEFGETRQYMKICVGDSAMPQSCPEVNFDMDTRRLTLDNVRLIPVENDGNEAEVDVILSAVFEWGENETISIAPAKEFVDDEARENVQLTDLIGVWELPGRSERYLWLRGNYYQNLEIDPIEGNCYNSSLGTIQELGGGVVQLTLENLLTYQTSILLLDQNETLSGEFFGEMSDLTGDDFTSICSEE